MNFMIYNNILINFAIGSIFDFFPIYVFAPMKVPSDIVASDSMMAPDSMVILFPILADESTLALGWIPYVYIARKT